MEKVRCRHGTLCLLKTGTTPGPKFNVSFYMCINRSSNCNFVQETSAEAMKCRVHKETVSIRVWDKSQKYVNYICSAKRKSTGFCGHYFAAESRENKENVQPLLDENVVVKKEGNVDSPLVEEVLVKKNENVEQPLVEEVEEESMVENVEQPLVEEVEEESMVENVEQPLVEEVEEESMVENVEQPLVEEVEEESMEENVQPPLVEEVEEESMEENVEQPLVEEVEEESMEGDGEISDFTSETIEETEPVEEDDSFVQDCQINTCTAAQEESLSAESLHSLSDHSAASLSQPNSSVIDIIDSPATDGPFSKTTPVSDISSTHFREPIGIASDSESDESEDSTASQTASACVEESLSVERVRSLSDRSIASSMRSSVVDPVGAVSPPSKTALAAEKISVTSFREPVGVASDSESDDSIASSADSVCAEGSPNVESVCSHLDKSAALTMPSAVDMVDSPVTVSCISKTSSKSIQQPVNLVSDSESDESEDSSASPVAQAGATERENIDEEDGQVFKVGYQAKKVRRQYYLIEHALETQAAHLPDGGAQLRAQKELLLKRLKQLKLSAPQVLDQEETAKLISQRNFTAQSKTLTTGAIVHLHSSLGSCPSEGTLADDPPGLTVSLMIHQKRALAWMMWRETQTPAAGILADDMGLGKTLSMLSLVWTKKGSREEVRQWMREPPAKTGLVRCPATLVVCPASLMLQWEDEAKSKIRDMSVYVYHGKKITTYPHDLIHYDLVVTTYNTLGIEEASCEPDESELDTAPKRKRRTGSHTTLFKIHWRRVILDEAHTIRNPKAGMSLGACKLAADYRWAVTGTPIQNKLKDFYSLIKFIHLAPFDDFRIWKETVERKGSLGMKRLDTMVASLLLRRAKGDLSSSILKLTEKVVTQHSIKLKEDEMAVHKYMYGEARKVMYSFLQDKGEDIRVNPNEQALQEEKVTLPSDIDPVIRRLMEDVTSTSGKGTCVLLLLLRLRQSCCHMKLLVNNLDSSTVDPVDDVDLRMDALSLNSSTPAPVAFDVNHLPDIFSETRLSTKISGVISEIKRITDIPDQPPQKCVVVSQWTKMLDIIEFHLKSACVSTTRIDGTVSPAERLNRVKSLNSKHKNPSVMLLSLQAGGVGLNLIGANHLFILDMHWNPALEQQAADRCHRVGQARDVFIHKFVCAGTIEERILQLQTEKLKLASNVLTGASQKSRGNALSLNDLKTLFELH